MAKAKFEYWLTKEGLLQIGAWARDGLIDEQIAHNMGIRRKTLYEWKKKYSDIRDALKINKEIADIEIENALYKKAMGFVATDIIYEKQYNEQKGEYELVPVRKTEKEIPPDTTAQIFWLKNRKPNVWSDRKDFNLKGEVDTTSSLSDDELNKKIANLEKKLGILDE